MKTLRNMLAPLLMGAMAAACGSQSTEPPLAGARIGGPFSLTDQDGKTVTEASLTGKYRIMYFGYTYCPDVCPTDLALISAGLKAFEMQDAARGARVQPVFVSINPARDTSARLKTYLGDFHPRIIGLTGSAQQIADMARIYGVPYGKGEGSDTDYLMNHGNQVYLMAPDGKPIALMPTEAGKTPKDFAAELDRWVK